MANIENLFKHNIFFENKSEYCIERTIEINLTALYKSNIIYDIKKLGIKSVFDLELKIKPFLYYLASKYLNPKQKYCRIAGVIVVGLFYKNESYGGENIYRKVNKFYSVTNERVCLYTSEFTQHIRNIEQESFFFFSF